MFMSVPQGGKKNIILDNMKRIKIFILLFFIVAFLSSQQVSITKTTSTVSKIQCILKHIWLTDNKKSFFYLILSFKPKLLTCSVSHISLSIKLCLDIAFPNCGQIGHLKLFIISLFNLS